MLCRKAFRGFDRCTGPAATLPLGRFLVLLDRSIMNGERLNRQPAGLPLVDPGPPPHGKSLEKSVLEVGPEHPQPLVVIRAPRNKVTVLSKCPPFLTPFPPLLLSLDYTEHISRAHWSPLGMSRLASMGFGLLRSRHAHGFLGRASFIESRSPGLVVLQKRGLGSFRPKGGLSKGRDYRTLNRSSGRVVRLLAIGLTASAASLLGLLVSNFIQLCCSCEIEGNGACV